MAQQRRPARGQQNRLEGLTLNKDGTASVTFDGDTWRLRRPKFGEFRELREALHGVQDVELEVNTLLEVEDDEERRQARAAHRAGLIGLDEVHARWINRCFAMLGDAALPVAWEVRDGDDKPVGEHCETEKEAEAKAGDGQTVHLVFDDWPTWLTQARVIEQLYGHFRTVPLAPGAGG